MDLYLSYDQIMPFELVFVMQLGFRVYTCIEKCYIVVKKIAGEAGPWRKTKWILVS